MRGGHDRVEVVVDRRVLGGHVVVGGRAGAVAVGVADQRPRRDRPIGDVELHRTAAAAGEVETAIDTRRGREGRLLPVNRGQQQPVDAERLLGRGVDRVEALHPALGDVRAGRVFVQRKVTMNLRQGGIADDRVRAVPRADGPGAGSFRRHTAHSGSVRGTRHRCRRDRDHRRRRGGARGGTTQDTAQGKHEHRDAQHPQRKRYCPRAALGAGLRDITLGVTRLRHDSVRPTHSGLRLGSIASSLVYRCIHAIQVRRNRPRR